jgi:ATP-dependent HslUV protease ATP-binding subunit HslU
MTDHFENSMTPKEIVDYLDQHIIGQGIAKRAVAIALRNRWRRLNLLPEFDHLREDIIPKNILMMGSTGVGKTEIARRIAKMTDAPFVKVEATKFTEIGYVGRDVEQIIRDLMEEALILVRRKMRQKYTALSHRIAMKQVATILKKRKDYADKSEEEIIRMMKAGELDHEMIEVSESKDFVVGDLVSFQNFFKDIDAEKSSDTKMPIARALEYYAEKEADRYVNEAEVIAQAKKSVEKSGIVFIDEIDKICTGSHITHKQSDVSREGVQRDLLPIIEGTTVSTKYGSIKTDHILFIGAGAFHMAKPTDLIPELQGRFPIKVELQELSREELVKILTVPKSSILAQGKALIASEGITLDFTEDAIEFISEYAVAHNKIVNIGARRLFTVMEKVLEDIYFDPVAMTDANKRTIDKEFVQEKLGSLPEHQELARFYALTL